MLIGFILLLVMLGLTIFANIRKDNYLDDAWIAVIIIGWILCAALLALGIAAYTSSIGFYGELNAYADVKAEYEAAVSETKDAVIPIGIAGLLVNMKHSTENAMRIKEKRDYVVGMMERKAQYREYTRRWIYRLFMAEPPEGLLE